MHKRTATAQVDTTTGETKGFMVEESGESGFSHLSRGVLILIIGLVGIAIVTVYSLKSRLLLEEQLK